MYVVGRKIEGESSRFIFVLFTMLRTTHAQTNTVYIIIIIMLRCIIYI